MVDKSEKADASRNRILDAAAALFREQGYVGVSLRAIASDAGMKAGSVYYHFGSKEEIVIEVLNLGINVVHDEVKTATVKLPPDVSASGLIAAAISSHLHALFTYSAYTSANVRIYGQVPEKIREANLNSRRQYETLWESLLKTAVEKGAVRSSVDLKAFRRLLIGSLNATLEWFNPEQGDVDELAKQYCEILLHGLLKKGEEL